MPSSTLTAAHASTESRAPATPLRIADVYDAQVDFVARMARGLGVPASAVPDVVQDVFMVVHRKLPSFEGRAKVRTWIARIVINVVRNHRRAHRKRLLTESLEDDGAVDESAKSPERVLLERQAVAVLQAILATMSEEQRVVFVMAEIEGLEMNEIAEALSINPNTGYSRLRLARKAYQRGVERARARAQRGEETRESP
ncbi:MAG: RNA polymerase sigma factor [Sandaracinaceae bacterium]